MHFFCMKKGIEFYRIFANSRYLNYCVYVFKVGVRKRERRSCLSLFIVNISLLLMFGPLCFETYLSIFFLY